MSSSSEWAKFKSWMADFEGGYEPEPGEAEEVQEAYDWLMETRDDR